MQDIESTIVFAPWIGDGYKAGIEGKRVMILGESLYHSCEDDLRCRDADQSRRDALHREFNQAFIADCTNYPHSSPLSYRVPELFAMDKREFWPRVSFYNYLQTFAGPKARVRPGEDQWCSVESAIAFQEALDELEPDRVLVLGRKLWTYLPSDPKVLASSPEPEPRLPVPNPGRNYSGVDLHCYWYRCKSGQAALLMPVMHPSAPRFAIENWTDAVARWLRFDEMPGAPGTVEAGHAGSSGR